MNAGESIESRRSAILALAAGEMDRARSRRVRRARIATAAAIVALGAVVAVMLPREVPQPAATRAFAIDFQSIRTTTESVDFSIVRGSGVPLLDTLTDDEAEAALEEAGYCVRLLRMDAKTQLVDCSSGKPAVIR
ncbi:MAG: hypothetical protein RIT24_546 [Planctomycetota bacterium]|jgi:hypothetical protein